MSLVEVIKKCLNKYKDQFGVFICDDKIICMDDDTSRSVEVIFREARESFCRLKFIDGKWSRIRQKIGETSDCTYFCLSGIGEHFGLFDFAAFCRSLFGELPVVKYRDYLYVCDTSHGRCVVLHNILAREIEIIADGKTKKIPDYHRSLSTELVAQLKE